MLPVKEFRGKSPEFWAVVKLVSQEIGYSHRATQELPSRIRAYTCPMSSPRFENGVSNPATMTSWLKMCPGTQRREPTYPGLNQPRTTWEIKEHYGTTTFGSRVADGVYETALDGYELNDLRDVGVEVEHYLFLDDRFTWWERCRLHR